MKFVRYLFISILLCLLGYSVYGCISPDIVVSHPLGEQVISVSDDVYDDLVAKYRVVAIPWVIVIVLILLSWIFLAKRLVAYCLSMLAICLLFYLIVRDVKSYGDTLEQQVTALKHGVAYSFGWLSVFYFLSAAMVLPFVSKKRKGAEDVTVVEG